jgi:hypothetical protein
MEDELKQMKESELFIVSAFVVKGFKSERVLVNRMISKKDRKGFVDALKVVYGVNPDNPDQFERIDLITIMK